VGFGDTEISEEEFRLKEKINRERHSEKTRLCNEKGIRLFHIFEHQWTDHKDQIINFIKTILNKNNIKIAARKCKITNSNSNDFINANHIQENTNSVIRYFNLEYDGQTVASMTASRHHRNVSNDKTVVLSRLCFLDGYNVQGGSTRLFKAFSEWSRESGYEKVISWSDNCWTEGNIYKVLNFELKEEFKRDYFYYNLKTGLVLSKQSQKKTAVDCPEGMTETEWAHTRGLFRIWDCGKKRWEYDLSIGDFS